MDTKYLSDGRKVVVVGQINNQETIVQEIFVTKSGDEVPSGERFVVRSLHNEPVISYIEKKKNDINAKIKECEARLEKAKRANREAQEKLKGMQELVKQAMLFKDKIDFSGFDRLLKFISGSIEWIVIDSSAIRPPERFHDEIIKFQNNYGERRFDALKLLSVFGTSDGNIQYNIHQYSDGSGGRYEAHPFESYEEAIEHIKNREIKKIRENKHYSVSSYEKCVALGIEFPQDCVDIIRERAKAELVKVEERARKQNEENKKNLKELTQRLKGLQ